MANRAESAMHLLQRAEDALKRRARRVIPADEANLRAMVDSPVATVELSEDQQRELDAIERQGTAVA